MKALTHDPIIKRDHILACHVEIMRDEKPLRFCTADVRAGLGITGVFGEDGMPVLNAEKTAFLEEPYTFDCVRLNRDAPDSIRAIFADYAAFFKASPVRFEA